MFQFPRCPRSSDPRCPAVRRAGCPIRRPLDHRLPAPPRAFRRVATSFLGRPAPRHPPCALHSEASSVLRPHSPPDTPLSRAGPARASKDYRPPGHAPPRRHRRVPDRCRSRSRPDPPARPVTGSVVAGPVFAMVCDLFIVQCARATGHERSLLPQGRTDRPAPAGSVSRGRGTARVRVAHCQGAGWGGRGDLALWRRSARNGWSRGDSNPGPPPCKGGALPAKLRPPDTAPRPARWARLDSNQGPRPYQGRALTS